MLHDFDAAGNPAIRPLPIPAQPTRRNWKDIRNTRLAWTMDSPLTESMIASSVLASLALLFCIFRLWIRIRIQRVGWEDIWAAVALVCGTINVVSDWIYVMHLGVGESAIISMWIYMITFTSILWAVRISIMFSIIRIIPTGERLHIYGLTIVAFFLLVWFSWVVLEAIQCNYADHVFHSTPSDPYFICSPPRAMAIAQLAVGYVADIIAVVFPLYVLRTMTLRSRKHRLLGLLFSSSLMVSIVCSIRAACQLVPELTSWSIVLSNFQIATCLIICNLLVIVTHLYRVLGHQGHDSISDTNEQNSAAGKDELTTPSFIPQEMTLTTIELMFSTQSGESVSVATGGTGPKTVSNTGSSC